MCGIVGYAGLGFGPDLVKESLRRQHHRGPDASDLVVFENASLGHNRLKIIDLSSAANQPMGDSEGRFWLVFNGEIYNYRELRKSLVGYPFRTASDSEVLLAAYLKWGPECLHRFIGMFAFAIWDKRDRRLFLARDRFGVKPLFFSNFGSGIGFASEIRTLHQLGVRKEPDWATWATYLKEGLTSHSEHTFWSNIRSLAAGHWLEWQDGVTTTTKWYCFEHEVGDQIDQRSDETVEEEYIGLLEDAVTLRFRADVPLSVNLSGGLDSSMLLALVKRIRGAQDDTRAFTFFCGDPAYDELPWVQAMVKSSQHELVPCLLRAQDVPQLHRDVSRYQSEPYGGIPTLAYQQLFKVAGSMSCKVLLDGQGMDEPWAGYDYYRRPNTESLIQGTRSAIVNPASFDSGFLSIARPFEVPRPFQDRVRNLQFRDLFFTKIPRALRFNDRISMMHSVELREPFLDHRLVELAFRQPVNRKIEGDIGKVFLRRMARHLIPQGIRTAPKRPVQTPQREWFRGPLRDWVMSETKRAARAFPDVVSPNYTLFVKKFLNGHVDNSFFIWQLISLAYLSEEIGSNG